MGFACAQSSHNGYCGSPVYKPLLPATPHSWVAQFDDDGVGGVLGAESVISSALRLRLIGAGATTNGHRVMGAGAATMGTTKGNTLALSVCFQSSSCSATSKFVDLIVSFAAWASSSWAAAGGTVGLSITRWMILPAWARTRDDGGGTAGGAGLAIRGHTLEEVWELVPDEVWELVPEVYTSANNDDCNGMHS